MHSLLLVVLFHFTNEFLQVIDADLFTLDKRRDGTQVGFAEELVDHALQRAAAVLLTADEDIGGEGFPGP